MLLPDIATRDRVPLIPESMAAPSNWPSPVRLPRTIEKQNGTNTCWAAVAMAVARAYGASKVTQCEIIHAVLAPDCCTGPFNTLSAACDKPCELPPALRAYYVRTGDQESDRSPDYIRRQLDAAAPVAVRIRWNGGEAGHFVLISGYVEVAGVLHLYVDDPSDGLRHVWSHERFASSYEESGDWHLTIETAAPKETK